MKSKWFLTGALNGSSAGDTVDFLFEQDNMDRRLLSEIDVFFYADSEEKEYLCAKLPSHIMVVEEMQDERLEHLLNLFKGRDFYSRIGHDIINLVAPLSDYQYLSEHTIHKRIDKTNRFGQQINIAGHLLQNDLFMKKSMDMMDFLFHFNSNARKRDISFDFIEHGSRETEVSLPPEKIATALIDEIILNWEMHSQGEEQLLIDYERKRFIFSNKCSSELNLKMPKAVLRRAFYKYGNNDGNGLGLFLISLASERSGFQWDVVIEDSIFTLAFSF